MPVVRALVFVLGAAVAVATLVSAVNTVIVPRGLRSRLSKAVFVSLRMCFDRLAPPGSPYARRDRVLAAYAPVGLLLLPAAWIVLEILAFAAMHWGVRGGSFADAFAISGSSLLTLGTAFRRDLPSELLSFAEAVLGLALVALVISFLPTIYSAFSRREAEVTRLEGRAGTPPSPVTMLTRYQRISMLHGMDEEFFPRWETWFTELEESHASFPALVHFRSPSPDRSWVTAAGCVLDTAAIFVSAVDRHGRPAPHAQLCLRAGFLALRRVVDGFEVRYDANPAATDPISVTREEFLEVLDRLVDDGVPVVADRERAWRDFAGWRVNYDVPLVELARMTSAPPGTWSTDRIRPGTAGRRRLRSGGVTSSRR